VKATVGFVVFVIVVLAVLFLISGPQSPRIPDDENHVVWNRTTLCLDCHGPEAVAPRGKEHPPKDACLKCHKVKRNRKASE